jgi:myo-inositol 2-dehydrogenase/D-chiro-inositol 1-dehydrogenase
VTAGSDGERVRIAVVGAGRMGIVHLRALAGSTAARPAGVVDTEPAGRARAAELGIPAYYSVAALIDAGVADAAIVAVPTSLHGDVCGELLRAGVATLCEKPAGLDSVTTRSLADEARRTATPLQVGYWRRFVPALAELRDAIASGGFGAVSLVVSAQWDHRPPPAAFRRTSGGIAVDMGVHEFDQVRWLTGQEFGRLSCTADGAGPDPDTAVLSSRLSGGTIAVLTLGRSYPRGDACRVEVLGPESARVEEFLRPADGDRAFVDAIARQADAFAGFVRGAVWSGASIDDAVRALTLAEEATMVMADGASP